MSETDRRSNFNTLADDYAKYRTSYDENLFDAILAYARTPPGGRVLDLACGTGLGMQSYVRRGFSVTGVDLAPAMMEQARKEFATNDAVTFATGPAEALPFEGASFDLISCAQAFHWFEPHAAFRECVRVLKPGGALAAFWKHAARDDPFTLLAEGIIRDWLGDAAALRSRDHADEHEQGWDVFWQYVAPAGQAANGRQLVDGEKLVLSFSLERTPEQFVGYQRSREKIRKVLGDRRDKFLYELDRRLLAHWPASVSVKQRQIEYVFLARKPA